MTTPDRAPDDQTWTVEIPARTASTISNRLRGTEFESVDDYVAFALDQLLRELDRPGDDDARTDSGPNGDTADDDASDDEATDDAVADRLESLGYL